MKNLAVHLNVRTIRSSLYFTSVLLFLGGCTAVDISKKTITTPQAAIPDLQKFTIAVLPFETIERPQEVDTETKSKPEQYPFDEKWRDFEKSYFPARLVQTLSKSPWVKEAYVSPVITPSVDFLIRGGIVESNGESTEVSITLTRCCWSDEHTEMFSIDLASSHFENMEDPGALLWIDPVNKIGELLAKTTPEHRKSLQEQRVAAYLGEAAKRTEVSKRPAKLDQTIGMASGWERTNLLGRVTKLSLGKADASSPFYAQWQKENTKHWEQKRSAELNTALSILAAGANLGAGIASARVGAPTGLFAAGFGASTAMAVSSAKTVETKMKEIEKVTANFGEQMDPTTVELNGQIYTLTGSLDAQIAGMNEIVRSEILKMLEQ